MSEEKVLESRVCRLERDCDRIDKRLFDLHSEVLKDQGETVGELKSLRGYVDKMNERVRYLEGEFKNHRTRLWAILILVLAEIIAQVVHIV